MVWTLIWGVLGQCVKDAEGYINERIGRWISPRRY